MHRITSVIVVFLFCFFYISGYSQSQYYVSTLAGDSMNISLGVDSNAGYRDGAGDQALFNSPAGLAIDTAGKYLYVADVQNNIIRKIKISNGMVTTIAGDTADIKKGLDSNIGYVNASNPFAAKFDNPWGVCVDDSGNVYVADTYNNVIRKIWASSGEVTTYAGRDSAGVTFAGYIDGPDSSAEFYLPLSLAIDTAGNIYVTDYGNNAIREIEAATHIVTTIAGQGPDSAGYTNGPFDTAQFEGLYGIALGKGGAIFASQFANGVNAVRRLDHNTVSTYAGYDTAGIDTNALSESLIPSGYQNGKNISVRGDTSIIGVLFNDPTGIAFDTSGNLLIADEYNNVIRIFNANDSVVSTFAGNDSISIPGFLNGPDSVAEFFNPMGLAADKKGNFFVADIGNNLIREISTNPNPTGIPSVNKPANSLSVYPNPCSDRLNIVSSFNGEAILFDVTGRIVWTNNDYKSPFMLSTAGVSPGIYFLRITSPSSSEIKKIEIVK